MVLWEHLFSLEAGLVSTCALAKKKEALWSEDGVAFRRAGYEIGLSRESDVTVGRLKLRDQIKWRVWSEHNV